MDSIIVKRSSWHYRLVEYFQMTLPQNKHNICRYMWQVLGAMLLTFLMIVVLILAAGMLIVVPVFTIIRTIHTGVLIPPGRSPVNTFGIIGLAMDILALTIFSLYKLLVLIIKRHRSYAYNPKRTTTSQPSLFSEAYRAIKDKTCKYITFQ